MIYLLVFLIFFQILMLWGYHSMTKYSSAFLLPENVAAAMGLTLLPPCGLHTWEDLGTLVSEITIANLPPMPPGDPFYVSPATSSRRLVAMIESELTAIAAKDGLPEPGNGGRCLICRNCLILPTAKHVLNLKLIQTVMLNGKDYL